MKSDYIYITIWLQNIYGEYIKAELKEKLTLPFQCGGKKLLAFVNQFNISHLHMKLHTFFSSGIQFVF